MKMNLDGHQYNLDLPDACPLCHRHVQPEHIGHSARTISGQDRLQIIWRCPNSACQRAFIATYDPTPNVPRTSRMFRLCSVAPRSSVPPPVPPEVEEISASYKTLVS